MAAWATEQAADVKYMHSRTGATDALAKPEPEARYMIYPPSITMVTGYIVHLVDGGCAPTVPDSFRGTIRWMGSRLDMEVPNMDSPEIKAMRDGSLQKLEKSIREAPTLHRLHVEGLEYVTMHSSSVVMTILAGWLLMVTYGSLRCDDAIHVRPSSLRLRSDAIVGQA